MTSDEHDIYIIFARTDGHEIAGQLHHALSQHNIRAVYDQRSLPSHDVSGQIEATIAASSAVLVCLTPDLLLRGNIYFLRREVIYAQICHKPMLMVMTSDYPTDYIPPFGDDVQLIDLGDYQNIDACIDEIIDWLDHHHDAATSMISEDPYYDYLARLYRQSVLFLEDQVCIPLNSKLAQLPMMFTIPRQMSNNLELPDKAFDYLDNFTDAFNYLLKRAFLLGEPGIGKSITLMTYARDAVAARLGDTSQPVPIIASIDTWIDFQEQPFINWLAYVSRLAIDTIDRLGRSGKLLLLLDGLEQLSLNDADHQHSRTFIDRLQDYLDNNSDDIQVLITSRRDSFDSPTKAIPGVIMLNPLTDGQIADYLSPYPALRTALEANPTLRALCRDPFLLSAFALIYTDSNVHASTFRRWSKNIAVLQSKILDDYIQNQYVRQSAPSIELEQIYVVLGNLATRTFLEGRQRGQLQPTNNVWPDDVRTILRKESDSFIKLVQSMHLLTRPLKHRAVLHFAAPMLRNHLALFFCLDNLFDATLQHNAVWVLGQIKDFRATEGLVELLYETVPMKTRREIAVALGNIGDSHALDALSNLLLRDQSPHVRRKAAEALARLDDPLVFDPLIQAMNDEDASVRASVIEALAIVGGATVIDVLMNKGLTDPDAGVRWQAAHEIGCIGRPAIPPLIDALEQPDTCIYDGALAALAQMGELPINPLLTTLVRGRKNLRRGIGEALIRIGTPATLYLVEAIKDVAKPIKAAIIAILGEIGAQDAVDALIEMATHEEAWIRINTAIALGQIGDERAVPVLIELLSDGEEPFFKERVCDAALDALGKIDSLEARRAIEQWQRRCTEPDQP